MPPLGVIGEAYIALRSKGDLLAADIKRDTQTAAAAAGPALEATGSKAVAAESGLKGMASAATGLVVFAGAAKLMEGFVDQASAVARSGRITAQILKDTGDAAGVTAKHVEELARQTALKTGLDRESISAAENILLTNTKIRNEGPGQAAIFDRTAKAAVDLSTVMGKDIPGAAQLLSKAMADPAKAAGVLRKAGIVLNEDQKALLATLTGGTIKTLPAWDAAQHHSAAAIKAHELAVKNHTLAVQAQKDPLKAQELILSVIEGRYKGAAEAASSSGTRLKAQWKDMQVTIGQTLLPVLKDVNIALSGFLNVFMALPGPLKVALPIFGLIAGAMVAIHKIGAPVVAAIKAIRLSMTEGALAEYAFLLPWLLLAAAIAVAVIVIIKNWDTIKNVFSVALDFIKNVVGDVVGWIEDHWKLLAEILITVITGPLGLLAILFVENFDKIKNIVGDVVDFLASIPGRIADFAIQVGDEAIHLAEKIVEGIASVPGKLWDLNKEIFDAGVHLIETLAAGVGSVAHKILDAIKNGIKHLPGGGFIAGILDHIPGFAMGGIVPGPTGEARLAIVHGGEKITPPGAQPAGDNMPINVQVFFHGAVPTAAEAFRTGRAAGDGVAAALRERQIKMAFRTAS